MFSGSPYAGADGGFHGVFGRGTPDLDEHPESAKSRAAWLSVEEEQDVASGPATSAEISLAEILNQRDRDLITKRNQMVQDNLEPARRLMVQSLHETIGFDAKPTVVPPVDAPAGAPARAALATTDRERPSNAPSPPPTASSGSTPVVADKRSAEPAASGRLGRRSSLHPSTRTEKDAGGKAPPKVPMSRELLQQQFIAKNSDILAAASAMWNFDAGSAQSSMSTYLYDIGLMTHTESIEKAFEQLFPNHPVSEASLKAMDKLDLDRVIRTAGVNPHDAKKLRDRVLGAAGPRSAPGDDHFDEHFDPSRVRVSNTPWDQTADEHRGVTNSSVLHFEGSAERRPDSQVIKSPALGGAGLSFRSSRRKQGQSEDMGSMSKEPMLSIRGMQRHPTLEGNDVRGHGTLEALQMMTVNDTGGHKVRLAAKEGRLEDLRALLDKHSGGMTMYDQQGRTPLFLAAEAGHDECVDELLRRGSDPNLSANRSEGKHSPLTVAAKNGHHACVKLLLAKGARVDHVSEQLDSSGSALSLAVNAGHIPCVRALLIHKASTETQSRSGHTPLSLAAARGRLDCLNALLEHGAQVDARHKDSGRTPFMLACQMGREDCVTALVNASCNKDTSDESGQTGLMLASSMGHRIIVEYLIKAGCDPQVKDNEGKTASDLAKSGRVTEYFEERSAGAAEELMAMIEQEEVNIQTKEKVKKKKKHKKKKQKHDGNPEMQSAPEPEPEMELEPETETDLDPEVERDLQMQSDTKTEQRSGTNTETQLCTDVSGSDLGSPPEPERNFNFGDEAQTGALSTSQSELRETEHALQPALQPKTKRKNKKKTTSAADVDSGSEELPTAPSLQNHSGDDKLRRLRQGLAAATAADADQQAQQQISALKRETKALQWKVEALEQQLAKQAAVMAAQEADFSARIEESWQDSSNLREVTASLQRDRDIAQHEAAQYRRQKEELENALTEKRDETDVSRRARSESEILLTNENRRLRAENKELHEVLEKERTSATHANQQFQAHMQQMNRASFDQGTRLQQANNIIRQLQTGNAVEDVDADALRRQRADYMLHQLQIITNNWIHDIGDARGVHQTGSAQLRAYLFTFGSFRLEVDDASADVDVLVMVPPLVDREIDFFGLGPDQTYQCPSLLSRLEQDERARSMVAVVDAYVPCIKMSFGGIDFDLTFANVLRSDLPQQSEWGDDINSWRAGPSSFAADGAMRALAHDLPAVRSFVGVQATHYVLRSMMQHYDTFRQTLVHVKAWAKKHGIYGSMMGYPGGVAWTILTAFYCRERFSTMPSGSSAPPSIGSMLAGFFDTWAKWQWPQPVELISRSLPTEQQNPALDAEVWHPGGGGSGSTGDAIMPIISPAYPQMNTTHTVGPASFRVIQEELSAAASLSSCAGIGGCCALLALSATPW